MILHALEHAFLDTVRMVLFLLAAFLALEALEHYSNNYMNRVLGKVGKAGPAVGAVSVSYTHLDVYKRQVFSRPAAKFS